MQTFLNVIYFKSRNRLGKLRWICMNASVNIKKPRKFLRRPRKFLKRPVTYSIHNHNGSFIWKKITMHSPP